MLFLHLCNIVWLPLLFIQSWISIHPSCIPTNSWFGVIMVCWRLFQLSLGKRQIEYNWYWIYKFLRPGMIIIMSSYITPQNWNSVDLLVLHDCKQSPWLSQCQRNLILILSGKISKIVRKSHKSIVFNRQTHRLKFPVCVKWNASRFMVRIYSSKYAN